MVPPLRGDLVQDSTREAIPGGGIRGTNSRVGGFVVWTLRSLDLTPNDIFSVGLTETAGGCDPTFNIT